MQTNARGPTYSRLPDNDIDLFLSAGGVKGFEHFGGIEELELALIRIGTVTGVSVGSIIAAFYTNGYTVPQIKKIFLDGLKKHDSPLNILSCVRFTDPVSFAIGGCLSLIPAMRDMVKEFGLKPNNRLRVVASDLLTGQGVAFEGEDYDLALALAASCSLPEVFQPIWHFVNGRMRLLADGAMHHYSPPEYATKPSIFITFRRATKLPQEWREKIEKYTQDCQRLLSMMYRPWTMLTPMLYFTALNTALKSYYDLTTDWTGPIDFYLSAREVYSLQMAIGSNYVDPHEHLVVETGLDDVAGLYFGVTTEQVDEMVEDGRTSMRKALQEAETQGRIKLHYAAAVK